MLRRVDDAVLRKISETADKPDNVRQVEMSDTEGISSILTNLRARQGTQNG